MNAILAVIAFWYYKNPVVGENTSVQPHNNIVIAGHSFLAGFIPLRQPTDV